MFRKATHTDAEKIATLVNKAYRPDLNERGWTHEAELVSGTRINAKQVAELIDSNGTILIANDGNSIIGCVHIEPAELSCYIGMLATSPSLQNNGLGKQLLAAAEDFATMHYGATSYKISVLSSRPELLAFYERRGYQLTGTISPYPVDADVGQPRNLNLQVLDLQKKCNSSPINS
ncbi:GNAT family N-acetyltransferase [Methylotenera sp.]|uniref:GNAT family N-acetyltransferase n=1 Tax=Methylotenera sp. TaxID=2051956 RepID=UPI002733C2F5|nr:GNAT family N-acetyltransferase [Methylotenera sp.]MDP3210015.1 GNAT family N-acetyltransferase [Methylotenera sp.]